MGINYKIAVLGTTGMLGSALNKYLLKKSIPSISVSRKNYDALKDSVEKLTPILEDCSYVINCIGVIRQVISEYDAVDVLKINSIFPLNLALLCNKLNKRLIQVSTDCAFSGKAGNYTETDFTDGEDLYAISKICGEPANSMVLRTSVIGFENKSSVSLLEWSLSRKAELLNGYKNHFWNGVTTIEFAKTIESIITNEYFKKGIFHIYSPDSVSKYELLCLFNEIFNLHQTIKPVDTPAKCDRILSSNYPLSSDIVTLKIQQQLEELKDFYAN